MLASDPLIKEIIKIFVRLATGLKALSSHNLNDNAVLLENTCARLLNCVYGYALKNANAEATNFPAADLIDRDARIAFQITINDKPEKIRDTHRKAAAHNLADVVDKLTIFFVVFDAPAEPEESSKFTRCASPKIDTLDLNRLITVIGGLEPARISEVAELLEREVPLLKLETQRAIPAICNLPFESIGDLFVGRDEFQHALHASVATSGTTVIRSKQAIHGMGGVGKTRAAVEYGWKHASEYSALLFITADSPANLRTNFAALCGKNVLNLPEQAATDLDTQIAAATHWLKKNEGWFLILDNVDTEDAREAVRALTKQIPHGHILITTRLQKWPTGFTELDLDVFDPESSIKLLTNHTAKYRNVRDDDNAVAAEIAKHLGYLALALEQAAAWVVKRSATFAGYLAEWQRVEARINQEYHDKGVDDYHQQFPEVDRSLFVTFRTSTDQLSPEARQLFAILSWLAPDPIPMWAIEKLTFLGEPRSHTISLSDFSLARHDRVNNTISIHRMLQAIEQAQQPEEKPAALLAALEWVNREYPMNPNDVQTWPVAIPLTPHAIVAANTGAARDILDPSGRLLNQCAVLLKTRADYRGAELLYRKTLAMNEKALGNKNPIVAICLQNLALLLTEMDQFTEAEVHMLKALAIDESCFPNNDPKIAADLTNLGELFKRTNRLREAESCVRRSLDINKAAFGKDHAAVARDMNNLAQLLADSNRDDEAEPLMRQVLETDLEIFGDNHPTVAKDMSNLGLLLFNTKRFAEAEPLMRRALAIDESHFGDAHPSVSIRLSNLALLLKSTNRLAEAERILRRALSIDSASYGDSHSRVAGVAGNLASLLFSTDRFLEAEPLMRRALVTLEVVHGIDHPDIALALNNLAHLLKVTGRLSEAEPLMRRQFEIFLKVSCDGSSPHRHLMAAIRNYGALLMKMGDTEKQAQEKISTIMELYGMCV